MLISHERTAERLITATFNKLEEEFVSVAIKKGAMPKSQQSWMLQV
jgi:hypothetical protein